MSSMWARISSTQRARPAARRGRRRPRHLALSIRGGFICCGTSPSVSPFINFNDPHPMLYTIALVLIVLWLLGLVTSYTIGGFIHILVVVAIIMVLLRFIQGRRVL